MLVASIAGDSWLLSSEFEVLTLPLAFTFMHLLLLFLKVYFYFTSLFKVSTEITFPQMTLSASHTVVFYPAFHVLRNLSPLVLFV